MVGRSDCYDSYCGTTFGAQRWLSLDACGLVCVNLSLGLHIFALSVATFNLWDHSIPYKVLYAFFFVPCSLLAVASLYMAWSSDPGAVPMGARPLPEPDSDKENLSAPLRQRGIKRCRKCNDNFKPARAHHDSVTGRCIVKMDHYCPWIGNAVGALNHKFFVLFVFYTFLASIAAITMLIIVAMDCDYFAPDKPHNKTTTVSFSHGLYLRHRLVEEVGRNDLSNREDNIIVGGPFTDSKCSPVMTGLNYALLIISVIFLIFTSCMLIENYDTIQSNTGKIARMKIKAGFGGTELSPVSENYNEMFGGRTRRVSWHWFIPIPVKFPDDDMRDQILGYVWKKEWGFGPYRETAAPVTPKSSQIQQAELGQGNLNEQPLNLSSDDKDTIDTLKKRPSKVDDI